MFQPPSLRPPAAAQAIAAATRDIGFTMASDALTGSLLRTLAASKPAGAVLELGTGTGMGTAWLLDGMDQRSRLTTVDQNQATAAIARQHLGHDARVTFRLRDGAELLLELEAQGETFDLIFADTWPGKFTHLETALGLLKPGGLYVIDDLLPQPTWPADHAPKVPVLIDALARRPDLRLTWLDWSTGIMVAVKTAML